jgi:hypothetical protein
MRTLEPGRTSWTQILDVVRLGPDDDEAHVTAAQVRDVAHRLIAAGQWRDGDPNILVVFDAGHDLSRLAYLSGDLPVEVVGRIRADRVPRLPAPPRPVATAIPTNFLSWKARSSAAPSTTSPATAIRSRYGSGHPAPAMPSHRFRLSRQSR